MASGQVYPGRVAAVSHTPFRANADMTLSVTFGTKAPQSITVSYRSFGERDFKQREMVISGNDATAAIPAASLVPPYLEYFLTMTDGASTETYPPDHPAEQPERISLEAEAPGSGSSLVTILSPEPDEYLRPDDLLISFAVSGRDSTVVPASSRITLDGADLSGMAVFTGSLCVLRPENTGAVLGSGIHTIRIDLVDRDGHTLQGQVWNFTLLAPEAPGSTGGPAPAAPGWRSRASLRLETRNENVADVSTPYNRAALSVSELYDRFRIDGRLYGTNEEDPRRQPQNRYYIGGESPWLHIGYGDTDPSFTDMIMSGRRVRGLNAGISVGGFGLDVVKGDIIRQVESEILGTFPSDSLLAEQSRDQSASFVPYDTSGAVKQWAKVRPGTFSRDILVVRPRFGREQSHFGLTYLKSKDDAGSIRFGVKPQENLVVGSDFLLSFDRQNVEFSGQAAFSATNKDITRGTLSDADIDSTFKDPTYSDADRKNIKDARNAFSNLITVNENLIPLRFKNLPTLAYESGIALRYFDNDARFSFRRVGSSFESFGQTAVQTDVDGFSASDRIGLLRRRLMVSAGIERLHDNTAETKAATTHSTRVNASVSWLPPPDLPSVTVAWFLASNANDVPPDSLPAVDDRTNHVVVQLGKEFSFGVRDRVDLTVSTSARDDRTARQLDAHNTMLSLANGFSFAIPLRASLGISYNTFSYMTVLPADSTGARPAPGEVTVSYTSFAAGANYRLAADRLRLSGSFEPIFGDRARTLLGFGAEYDILARMSLESRLNLYLNKDAANDVIWSLILRAEI